MPAISEEMRSIVQVADCLAKRLDQRQNKCCLQQPGRVDTWCPDCFFDRAALAEFDAVMKDTYSNAGH